MLRNHRYFAPPKFGCQQGWSEISPRLGSVLVGWTPPKNCATEIKLYWLVSRDPLKNPQWHIFIIQLGTIVLYTTQINLGFWSLLTFHSLPWNCLFSYLSNVQLLEMDPLLETSMQKSILLRAAFKRIAVSTTLEKVLVEPKNPPVIWSIPHLPPCLALNCCNKANFIKFDGSCESLAVGKLPPFFS